MYSIGHRSDQIRSDPHFVVDVPLHRRFFGAEVRDTCIGHRSDQIRPDRIRSDPHFGVLTYHTAFFIGAEVRDVHRTYRSDQISSDRIRSPVQNLMYRRYFGGRGEIYLVPISDTYQILISLLLYVPYIMFRRRGEENYYRSDQMSD